MPAAFRVWYTCEYNASESELIPSMVAKDTVRTSGARTAASSRAARSALSLAVSAPSCVTFATMS